jgi:hypothetical protein
MHAVQIADLRKAFEQSREFTLYVGPAQEPRRSVTLRVPTEHQVKLAGLRCGIAGREDPAALALLERALLQGAIVGWSNLLQCDLVPSASAEPMPWAEDLVPVLLDAQPDWWREPTEGLFERLAQRNAQRDAAAKNS